jgi:glycosyltransferase involved in cell wall biosynthesis
MIAQRILICLHDFFPGGTERIAMGLAADWVDAGRDVTILCGTEDGGLRDKLDGRVRVMALDPPVTRSPFSRLRLGRRMAGKVAALRPNVIFLPGNFHALLANPIRRADPNPKIVLKVSNPPLPEGLIFAQSLFGLFTRGVDGFAAMNRGLAEQLSVLLPGRNIVSLYDPVYIHPLAHCRRRGGPLDILWIGRLEPQKDPGLALEVIKEMKEPAHLTLLGDGALRNGLERRICDQGLQAKITLAGYVEAIEPYLAKADVLLITSRYEGGPAVAVEALAQGVPVISTDCSLLLGDLLVDSQAGKIVTSRQPVDLASALAQVCALPPAPEKLQALVAPFAPKACAGAYLDWFDALVRHG